MIYTKVYVSGQQIDTLNTSYSNSSSDNNQAGNFTFNINNYAGENKDKCQIGQEVEIYNSEDIIRTNGSPSYYWRFNEGTGSQINELINNVTTNISRYNAQMWSNGLFNSGLFLESGIIGSPFCYMSGLQYSPDNCAFSFWCKNPKVNVNSYLIRGIANLRTYIYGEAGSIRFTKGNPSVNITTATALISGNWNHVVMQWGKESTGSRYGDVWINNRHITTSISGHGPYFADATSGTYVVLFGFDSTGRDGASGYLDEFRIYNKLLTPQEISEIYNNRSGTETITNENQKVFTGLVEDIKFKGKAVKETIEVSGRDYSARLMDRTVEPEVYTGLSAGSIVIDIINKYTEGISTSGVVL